jgi:tRNA(adenine34) deaminase
MTTDEFWMREALIEAQKTRRSLDAAPPLVTAVAHNASVNEASVENASIDDVPVGAICVQGGHIIGRGHNARELLGDPTAHAETLALRAAAQTLRNSHLKGVTLYVTLEPCAMCAGALWLARVERLVFGAWDARAGACGSVFDVVRDPRLNHRMQVRGGVLEDECAELLRVFFASRRGRDRDEGIAKAQFDTDSA